MQEKKDFSLGSTHVIDLGLDIRALEVHARKDHFQKV